MPLSEHEKTLAALMDQAGIVIELTPTPHAARDDWDAAQYAFVVTCTKRRREPFAGVYSMGWGHFKETDLPRYEVYAGNGRRSRSEVFALLTKGRKDSPVVQAVKETANRKRLPEPVAVFWSMLMDAQGSDQDFADWAADLGYSDDSIKGKTAWETCNATRRYIEGCTTSETLAAMYDAASEI